MTAVDESFFALPLLCVGFRVPVKLGLTGSESACVSSSPGLYAQVSPAASSEDLVDVCRVPSFRTRAACCVGLFMFLG